MLSLYVGLTRTKPKFRAFENFKSRLSSSVHISAILIIQMWQNFMTSYPSWHCMKSVQIRSYYWSVFSCIRTEYGDSRSKYRKIRTRNNSVLGHFSRSVRSTQHGDGGRYFYQDTIYRQLPSKQKNDSRAHEMVTIPVRYQTGIFKVSLCNKWSTQYGDECFHTSSLGDCQPS